MFPFQNLVPFYADSPSLEWAPHEHGRRRGVLVAADVGAIRGLLEAYFRRRGVACWVARNGIEAVDTFRANLDKIGLILLDVRMPDSDGPHAWSRLQAMNPVVICYFMSGSFSHYTEGQPLEMGARGLLLKPDLMRTLDAIFTEFMDGKQESP
jgi:CheY-like chemotaxis protein